MIKVIGIIILTAFYGVYFGKMAAQHKKGIRTVQMAKGKAKSRLFYTELTLKLATYLVVLAEISSLILASPVLLSPLVLAGIVFAVSGLIIFAASVAAMKDNWRAGIAENDRIGIVTKGIYQFSRNPAFLGFDCVYLGFLMMFWNLPLLLCSLFAGGMLHLQILQEEHFLSKTFGCQYLEYQKRVCRYLGRKRNR